MGFHRDFLLSLQNTVMTNVDLPRVPDFYHKYINLITEPDLTRAFQKHQVDLLSILMDIPEEKWSHRYDEGKWSIKELVQHIIDAERIFSYRALHIARQDKVELPGFEENDYAKASKADKRTKEDLIEELSIVQKASVKLFASFDDDQLNETGIANRNSIYVGGIGFIIIGHALHHKNILLKRYLQEKTIHA